MKNVCNEIENNTDLKKIPEINMLFDVKEDIDLRRYNVPRSNEVCAIIWRDSNEDIPLANVVVYLKGKKILKSIYPLSYLVEPMCYPLFYPSNSKGWDSSLKDLNGKNISLCDFTKYKLFYREEGKFLPHFFSGKLFQQWCVDQAARIEWSRLNYIKLHQKEICKEPYNSLLKILKAKEIEYGAKVKKQIILPTSFIGGPRNLHESFMDAMTIVNEVGKPDLFLTFTCNPNDEDIKKCLIDAQKTYDRPDIVARVFHLKIKQFLKEILEKKIFGKVKGYCYTIEFQKRGLPHLHMLLTLGKKYKLKNTEEIDKYISAEIPEENEDKELYNLVSMFMVHGPCGPDFPDTICWSTKLNKCTKKFPKNFSEKTEINENGYPFYKRPNNGKFLIKKDWQTGKTKLMTNQNIVPYNRYLIKRFASHINIEKVADIKAVKYIYKYIYKGYDAAIIKCISTENGEKKELIYDEANNYLDARYLSPVEACWKIFKFPLQEKSHSVMRLPVHLENEHLIYFEEDDDNEKILKKCESKSKLMAYFEFLKSSPTFPKCLYTEIPKYCVWNNKDNKWQLRKNKKIHKTLGRMYPVNPNEGEKYYLRYLLLKIPGTSFKDLKTINGIECNTFAEACLKRGLIKNDEEWRECLNEAKTFKFPSALRNLFSSILLFGDPKYPELLFEEFKNDLAEDFIKKYTCIYAYKLALSYINKHLENEGKSLKNFVTMPQEILINIDDEIIEIDEEKKIVETFYKFLNEEQKIVFEYIRKILKNEILNEKLIYIDGPGGTGKSYLLTAIYHLVRSYNKKIINMAFSGIAANLLKNGRTLHKQFKLPLNINSYSISNIVENTKEANEILETDFFVIDEAPMASKFIIEIINKKLQELTRMNNLFGNKTFILAGDFRQTLPIKKFAIRSEIVDLTIKKSFLWKYFKNFKLVKNIRAKDQIYAKELLEIGNGKIEKNVIRIPTESICQNNTDLVFEIYDEILKKKKYDELKNFMILSPYNDLVDYYNNFALEKLESESVIYLSIDEVETSSNFPITTEIMNSFNAPGFPEHKLILKKNCKVMLLRNINIKEGLCNGTILQVIELKQNIIRCIILGGDKNGNEVYIHRVSLITENEFPVPLKRHQFPLRLAFAVTFIKSQGSTYEKIGIDWTRQSFSHGQTYVALSRVGSWSKIKVKVSKENIRKEIDNIVWKEVL
uniref:ATP-dependent DNA helicase n=1 Tax=Meloidogyne enterolobii TaxID=390850 RepID=A0A6V7XF28_MELEN|nr:unnamed protein product [Meloidogyne enterolobii]